ncbi:MAG: ABC transporter permease [Salinarimonas sp.]
MSAGEGSLAAGAQDGASGEVSAEAPASAARRLSRRLPRLGASRTLALALALPLAAALGWEAAVAAGLAQGRLLPPPSRVIATFADLQARGELVLHVAATLWRVLVGFGLGAGAGLVLGALCGASRFARETLDPTLQALRAIPSIAWVPLFILWLGIFEASKVALIAVGVFFPVYLGVCDAIRSIDRKLLEVSRVFRLSRVETARRILVPAVLPETITALRSGLGLGFMFVVAAEFMGASEGLGYLLVDGQQMGKPDQILAAIVAFALLGKACDLVLVAATRPLVAWQDVARDRL